MHVFIKMLQHWKKKKTISLTEGQAHLIVKECLSCVKVNIMPKPSNVLTPQGLSQNHIWHMNANYVPNFKRLKYVCALWTPILLFPYKEKQLKTLTSFLLRAFTVKY